MFESVYDFVTEHKEDFLVVGLILTITISYGIGLVCSLENDRLMSIDKDIEFVKKVEDIVRNMDKK